MNQLNGPATKARRRPGLPKAALAKDALAYREQGFSTREIAEKMKVSQRYVFTLLKYARENGLEAMIVVIPDHIKEEDLDDAQKAMVKPTSDAFELFFNAYSGRTLAPVHKGWVEKALSTRRTLINCPPRHAKSTIFSVWFPLWLLARDRNLQILICSQTDKIAKKFTNEIAYHLAHNKELNRDFGRFRPEFGDWPWRPNQGELLVDGRSRETKSGDLSIQVRGAGQAILGMEANWIIVDDAVSRQNTRNEIEREKLSEWFHGDVMSRLEPKGSATVIGQRLHLYDLYGELAKEKLTRMEGSPERWNHINYQAISSWKDQSVLWPEKWDFEALMDVYIDVGQKNFEAMYQQNPLPEGERLVQNAWIWGDDEHRGCLDYDRRLGQRSSSLEDGPPRCRVLSLDPSPTKLAGLVVADVIKTGEHPEYEILELQHRSMNVRDMLSEIERVLSNYAPVDYFIFEQNAAQRWLLQDPAIDQLRSRVMVIPHTTNRNKADPVLGTGSLALDFEFGRVRLPYADSDAKQQTQLLIDEATTWPQGLTDDLLMALWFIKYNNARLIPRRTDGVSWNSERGPGFRPPPRLTKGFRWARRT